MIALPDSTRATRSLETDLAPLVREIGERPVLVTDARVLSIGKGAAVRGMLDCDVVVVPGGEPVSESVAAIAAELADRRVDVVVAIGGGSVLDTAKLAARLVSDPGGLDSRLLGAAPFPPGAAVVALPTTAGSGAEMTRTAIVSHAGHKTWAWDERLRPELAVLAPELTVTVPRAVALSAGLDAFCHSVEAATARRATPDMTALGLEAVGMVGAGLAATLAAPADADLQAVMLEAAAAGGLAIDQCGTGIGHAIGHALASVGEIPHGLAVMLGLRAGLEWTLEAAPVAYAGLGRALGGEDDVAALPELFDAFLAAVDFRTELARWAPPSASVLLAELAHPDHQPMCLNNARPITTADMPRLVDAVLATWCP